MHMWLSLGISGVGGSTFGSVIMITCDGSQLSGAVIIPFSDSQPHTCVMMLTRATYIIFGLIYLEPKYMILYPLK